MKKERKKISEIVFRWLFRIYFRKEIGMKHTLRFVFLLLVLFLSLCKISFFLFSGEEGWKQMETNLPLIIKGSRYAENFCVRSKNKFKECKVIARFHHQRVNWLLLEFHDVKKVTWIDDGGSRSFSRSIRIGISIRF